MLVELNIKNFAIIEELKINFTKGLNIITGETGSGKSILIEAIGIILGSRSNREFIQSGYEKAILEGVFYIEEPSNIMPLLREYSIDMDKDNLLIISKEIYLNGPSLSRINGRNVTLNMLKSITTKLVDIFGQHEHQSLLNSSNHEILIDSFGDMEMMELKSRIKVYYNEWSNERKKLEKLSMDSSERDREIDILRFQVQEIEEAKLNKNDDYNIENEYKKLANINEIVHSIGQSLTCINNESFGSASIFDLMNKSISLINNAKKFDEKLTGLHKRFEGISYELEDIYIELKDYLYSIDIDTERLNFLSERINLVNKLKKKYGNTIDMILDFRDKCQERLDELLNFEKEFEKTNNRILELEKNLEIYSTKLSYKRKEISKKLEKSIKEELTELNMTKVDFKVDFNKKSEFTLCGQDKIEFLISTNVGEDLKPLSKIVSGGEMSRIMLAFKSILAFFDKIPTMIFDEIDTGISGRTAQIVGEKIYAISKGHQVICISHLPQIAALADSHYVINKIDSKGRTKTVVSRLSDKERIEEMARLLGGVDLTDTTIRHASEMIEMSKKFKIKKVF
ncbi:DNA replication and repair protein RecN [Tissierella praeacuta]|uniref:DNA repair protein RecN n=1 Tax=Tissierella praeacuta TaxID=43131 RepID=UPI0010453AEB|nr:DNA repair protein RecN [Tissierella praeacuta]TCU72771.1 DNA replication and repair protein RecN [Tissierella praeacuta]